MRRSPAFLALPVVFAVACTDQPAPTAPAGVDVPGPSLTVVNTGFEPFNFTIFDECTGENVDFVTRQKTVFNVEVDPTGGLHVGLHRAWIGTGVGQTTGTVYNLNWPWQQEFQAPLGSLPFILVQAINNNLPSRGSADNRIFSLIHLFIIDANGNPRANVLDLTLTCQG